MDVVAILRLKHALWFIECPVMDTANLKIMTLEAIFVFKSDATVRTSELETMASGRWRQL